MTTMNYIGLDVHKKTISYCVKDVSGRIQQEGKVGATRRELDGWMKTLPQPWTVAMEATIFSGPRANRDAGIHCSQLYDATIRCVASKIQCRFVIDGRCNGARGQKF
jgi:hypothetical protein